MNLLYLKLLEQHLHCYKFLVNDMLSHVCISIHDPMSISVGDWLGGLR